MLSWLALAFYTATLPSACNLHVTVVDNQSKAIAGVEVIAFGISGSTWLSGMQTDKDGKACFVLDRSMASQFGISVRAFMWREVRTYPTFTSVPQDMTIQMRHLNWFEAAKAELGSKIFGS